MCSHGNVPDVSPHPALRSGQPCLLDWLAPSPTTVAARVSCKALRPGDEWCDPSRAGVPQGWEPGSSCCWGSACCCYLSLILNPASSGPSRTYLRSKQRDTQQSFSMTFVEDKGKVSSVSDRESKSYHSSNLKLCLNGHTVATRHKTREEQSDNNWSDNRIHICWQYPVIAHPTHHS